MSKRDRPRRLLVERLELRSMLTASLGTLVADSDDPLVEQVQHRPGQETHDRQRSNREHDFRSENRSDQHHESRTSHRDDRGSDHRDRKSRPQTRHSDRVTDSMTPISANPETAFPETSVGSEFQSTPATWPPGAFAPSLDARPSTSDPVAVAPIPSTRSVNQQEQAFRGEASADLASHAATDDPSNVWSGKVESSVGINRYASENGFPNDRWVAPGSPTGISDEPAPHDGLIDPFTPLASDPLRGQARVSGQTNEPWSIELESLHRLRGLADKTEPVAISQATDAAMNDWLANGAIGLIAIERFDLPVEPFMVTDTYAHVNLDTSLGQHRGLLVAAVEGSIPFANQIRDRVLAGLGVGDPKGEMNFVIPFATPTAHPAPMSAGLPDAALLIGTFAMAARRRRTARPSHPTAGARTDSDQNPR